MPGPRSVKKLTPQEDAELNAELAAEIPQVYDALERMFRHYDKLSDLGQKLAACEIMLRLITDYMPNESAAMALLENINKELRIGIKKRYASAPTVPNTPQ